MTQTIVWLTSRAPVESRREFDRAASSGSASASPIGFAAPLIAASLLIGEAIPYGLNNAWLAAWGAAAQIVVTIVIVGALDRGSFNRWPHLLPSALAILAAIAWGAWPRPEADPQIGHLELLKLAGAAAMVVSGVTIGAARKGMSRFAICIAILSLAYILFSLTLYRINPAEVFGESKGPHRWRFTGTLLNANAAGCLFGMLALLGFGVAQDRLPHVLNRRPGAANAATFALGLACALGGAGATAQTGSRISLLLTVLAGIVLMLRNVRQAHASKHRSRATLVGRLSLFAPLALGALLSFGRVAERSATPDSDLGRRWVGWVLDATGASHAWLMGVGLGNLPSVTPLF